MNMGKKKWAILLIIALVIGTGSYVFANPSLDSSKDALNPNHSVNPESNQNKESNTNGNVDVANNQDVLNIEDLETMDVPSEEAQILEQMITNNDTNAVINAPNETGTTIGNVVNTLPNNGNSGVSTSTPENNSSNNLNSDIGTNILENNNNNNTNNDVDTTIPGNNSSNNTNNGNNNNNPIYIPPGNTGSSGNAGSNPNTGNNTGSGNSGSTGSGTTQGGNTGTDVNPGNPGDNTGSGTGNTGDSNNPNPTNPSETPSFVFANDESFTNNTIVINDPNYDHMVVYNLNTRGRVEVYETEYTIDVEYAVYIFIVFNKDGSYQGYKMYHTKAEQ